MSPGVLGAALAGEPGRSPEPPVCSWQVRSTANSLGLRTGIFSGAWGAVLWDADLNPGDLVMLSPGR